MRSAAALAGRLASCGLCAICSGVTPAQGAVVPQFDAVPGQGPGVVLSDPTVRPMQGPDDPASIFATRPIDVVGGGRPDLFVCYGIVPPAPAQKMPCRVLRPQLDGSMTDVTRQLFGSGALPGAVAPRVILSGDFNEDGRADVFVAAQGWDSFPFPGEVNVLLLSNLDGTYEDASANLPQQFDFTHDAAVADIDGDGHLDLYVGNISGQLSVGPYILLGAGDGTFTKVTSGLPATITSLTEKFTACGLVDVDGDESPDLVLGTHGDGGYLDSVVLFNDGAGDFTQRPRGVLPDGPLGRGNTVVQGIGVLDIDRDGKKDLILPSSQYSTFSGLGLQILINEGEGDLADESTARLGSAAARWTGSPYQVPRFVDLNDDGVMDFYFSNGPVEDVPRYFLGNADGTFEPVAPTALPQGFGVGVNALRIDSDSKVDLIQVDRYSNGDLLYKSFLNHTVAPVFADGFEAGGNVCAWKPAVGSSDVCPVLTLGIEGKTSGHLPCGTAVLDNGPEDWDGRPNLIRYFFFWNDLAGETGYLQQIDYGSAAFLAEDDFTESDPGQTLSLGWLEAAPPDVSHAFRVIGHFGHAAGHGSKPTAGDVVSDECTVTLLFGE